MFTIETTDGDKTVKVSGETDSQALWLHRQMSGQITCKPMSDEDKELFKKAWQESRSGTDGKIFIADAPLKPIGRDVVSKHIRLVKDVAKNEWYFCLDRIGLSPVASPYLSFYVKTEDPERLLNQFRDWVGEVIDADLTKLV